MNVANQCALHPPAATCRWKRRGEMDETKDFIDFIIDAPQDDQLLKGFAETKNPEELIKFFDENGYQKINYADCKKIIKAKGGFGLTEWPPPPAY
jgi:hypothetical protein